MSDGNNAPKTRAFKMKVSPHSIAETTITPTTQNKKKDAMALANLQGEAVSQYNHVPRLDSEKPVPRIGQNLAEP